VKKEKDSIIIGLHPVSEALSAGKEINKILIRRGLKNESVTALFQQIRELKIPFQFVPFEKLNRITKANHQGIIAFVSQVEYQHIENILQLCYEQGKDPFIIVLDHLTDVRNFGAIARTAECAGVNAIVIPSNGSVSVTTDSIKTSAGALNHIPVCRSENLSQTVKILKDSGLTVIAATEKAGDLHFQTDLKGPIAIVMGSEESGINSSILKSADKLIKIPLQGEVQSLNVSVACGIVLYEILRQRMNG
jgi:23S rRNA (guanosine2251-2'-O)-methyltransferase